jgi:predicted O-linked N-acetylglucosamine transferase (SPINDLY family)
VRLPDTYWVVDTTRAITAETPTRAEAGLPEAGFVFCCFNNSQKIGPATFASWMRLLDAVPGSALWLLQDNAAASRNLRREAEARGIAPSRVAFAPRVPQLVHLARHRLADLFVDTLPYNAHTTASDALWTGLPVVTCTGRAFPSRVAQSQLVAAGLPELVSTSVDDYEALALRLARSPGELAAVRRKLALAHSQAALFDTDRFRRSFEAALTTMWERQQRGAPAAAFDVAPVA